MNNLNNMIDQLNIFADSIEMSEARTIQHAELVAKTAKFIELGEDADTMKRALWLVETRRDIAL